MNNQLKLGFGAALLIGGALVAQQPPPNIFRVSVTARTTKAINYQHRSGSTKIDFQGTSLLPSAHGEAKVESKQGYIEVEVEFRNLQPANLNGAEYLTYVLWAVTPEGRTANLGEVLLNGTSSKLDVTTQLQVFALVVTAEPYFAVSQPSDLVVMENIVRSDTAGRIEEVDAKYELLQRGQYERLANPLALKADKRFLWNCTRPATLFPSLVRLAPGKWPRNRLQKAQKSLAQAEAYQKRNAGKKPVAMMAREAVQMAEDARAITVKRQAEAAALADRQQAADRELRAQNGQSAAEFETRKAQADNARLALEKDAQANAARAKRIAFDATRTLARLKLKLRAIVNSARFEMTLTERDGRATPERPPLELTATIARWRHKPKVTRVWRPPAPRLTTKRETKTRKTT